MTLKSERDENIVELRLMLCRAGCFIGQNGHGEEVDVTVLGKFQERDCAGTCVRRIFFSGWVIGEGFALNSA